MRRRWPGGVTVGVKTPNYIAEIWVRERVTWTDLLPHPALGLSVQKGRQEQQNGHIL